MTAELDSHPLQRRTVLAATLLSALPWAGAQSLAGKPDAALFFRAPQMLGAGLSPDGQWLAMTTIGPQGRAVLSVLDLASMTPAVIYSSGDADVEHVVWVNNKRLALTLTDRDLPQAKIDAGPGLFAVDRDGEDFRQLVERQGVWARNGNDGRRLEPGNTFLLNGGTQRNSDEVLVARPEGFEGKDVDYIKLLRLNTRNGRSEEVDSPLHSVGWLPDIQGNLRVAVTRQGEKGSLRWKDPATGGWRTLAEFNGYTGDGEVQVSHVGPDGKLYINARRGRDKMAMWLLDPVTGSWSAEPLAQSPQFDVIAQVVARRDLVLGLRFTIDAEVTLWFDAGTKTLQAQIDKVLPRTVNRLTLPWEGDSPWVLIEAFADIQPTQFFLFNRLTRQFTRLGAKRPDIDAKQMGAMDLHWIKARDGLELPVWLTLPKGGAKNLPMVVLVHGGPFAMGPSWRWDAEAQFLAARGYAVLQPQFRGTKGFGEAHYKGGWRQWGKAMQTDLADATRWAIAQGIADPKRIAIAGASYGGYATLMGLLRDADLFRCGVSWVGATDLDLLYTVSWDDVSDDFKKQGMPRLVGDRIKDAADLKENSPLTHAAKITQPLLLAYGSADQRVPLVHGESFRKALSPGKLEWKVYEDEGHGWRLPANQIDFWNRTARFLDKQLAPI